MSVRAAPVVVACTAIVWCAGCGSTDTAAPATTSTSATPPSATAEPACAVGIPGPPSLTSVFTDHLPRNYAAREICAADVGPGLTDIAALSDLTAAEVTQTDRSPDAVALKALVGTAKSGDGAAFVDDFLSRVGETRDDTVTLGGRTVRYFNTSDGEGYGFAQGPTVVIGFLPSPQAGVDLASNQEPAKEVFTRVMAAAAGAPVAVDARTDSTLDTYPPARGRFTSPGDPGWLYFKTESVKGSQSIFCGIGPNGVVAGCDVVPSKDSPAGVNQTVVDRSGPAHYAVSETPTFTRDVDVLLPGHRLVNGDATCAMGYQGTVHCVIEEHSFVVSSDYAVLE